MGVDLNVDVTNVYNSLNQTGTVANKTETKKTDETEKNADNKAASSGVVYEKSDSKVSSATYSINKMSEWLFFYIN